MITSTFWGVKLSHKDIAEIEVLTDAAMEIIFLAFYIWGAYWRTW